MDAIKALLDQLRREGVWGKVEINLQAGEPVGEVTVSRRTKVADLTFAPPKR